ncbi:MAG: hypothetical protein ABSG67_16055 [Thermoguttaceae bacterium]
MKFNLHNQHRRQREGAPSISLFPFLAVLICTMGALVPLLFAITRQARLQAAQTAVAKIAERKAEIKTEHETMQWRIEQLRTSRTKTNAQVADARLELGHLEDHSRDLRQKFSILEKTVAELDKLDGDDNRQRSEQVEELNKLHAQIEAAKKQVTEAQLEAASRKKSYAIVPYEGPNQTYRRPIYLECRADAVVLQPEGIEFLETDFEGPLGPGNPLAAALRAVREYLLTNHGFDPQRDGEPYPLLLVRPDGISAYYAARAAMTSWATEFGYELIEADWKLAYQPPNVQLAKVVQEVLVSARARQQRLIAAAPGAYSKKPKAAYRASPSRGGSVPVGGSAYNDEDTEDSGFLTRQPSGRIGRGYGSSRTGTGYGSSGTGSGGGDDSPGPTEAERVASLYGNAGGGISSQGGPYPAGQSTGGQGGTLGNGYGPAIGGNMGGNVPQQGAAGGGYGTGSGTGGVDSTVAGIGSRTIAGGSGITGGNNGAVRYGDGSAGRGGAGSGSGTGNMNAGLAGQGSSTDGSPAYGGLDSSTQSGGYAGGNMGNGGYPSGNSGYGGAAGGSGSFGEIAGGRTTTSDNANNNLSGNGSTSGNGTDNFNGGTGAGVGGISGNGSGGAGTGAGGISGNGSGQATVGNDGYKGSSTLPEGFVPGNRGQGSGDKGSSGQITSAEGYIVGQPPTEKDLPDQKTSTNANHAVADQANGTPVMPLRPGEWREQEKPPVIKPDDEKSDEKKNGRHAKSLASKRGQDWALPDAAHGSVPVTRPIRVECRPDQLVIVPEAGLSGGKTVPLGTRTEASTEAFISAVWEHMESWGIAGRGMYWRPILNVYVAPGAEQRFADLQMLMAGSGLKIVRK